MSRETPTREPRSFIAGETLEWSKSLADYPATEWTLKYAMRGPGTAVNVTATADGDDYLVDISSTTSDVTAGTWRLVGWVEQGSEKHYVYDEDIIARAKPTDTGTLETRSTAKIIVDAIDALATGKASRDQQSYKIADRELVRMSPKELTDWRTYYWNIYVREERSKRGGRTMRNINCGF